MDTQMDDEVPILDEENYSTWRIEMKVHLKEIGAGVWKEAIGGSVPLKNKSKFAAQREEKKNDALALKTILSGLSSSIKESMGQCTSTKDLWLKLEETYQRRRKTLKTTPSRTMKVKNLQNPLFAMILNVMMLAKRNTLKTIPSRSMKVKNLQNPLIAIFQNVMMLNISLQVKKKI
jgi:hypothetical protein